MLLLILIPVGLLILRIDSSKSHGSRNGGDGRLHFISLGNEFEDQYFSDFLEWLELCGLSLIAINRAKNKKMKSEGDLPMLQQIPTAFVFSNSSYHFLVQTKYRKRSNRICETYCF